MSTDPDCLFCKIVAGEIPSSKIAEDERTFAFADINPGTQGHLLVIPKAHSQDLLEIGPEDLSACALMAQRLASRMVDRLGADGVNLMNCCGAAAWQTVFHFHLHVIPRYADDPSRDDLQLPYPPDQGGDLDAIAATAAVLAD